MPNSAGNFRLQVGSWNHLVHLIHRLVHHKTGHIRADVLASIVQVIFIRYDARKGLVGDFNVAVSLVVLEQDIVLGIVQLDQAALQHQCFKLTVGDDVVKIHHILHHFVHLGKMVIDGPKVAGYPVLEFFCFSHIDDRIVLILHDIDTRLHGEFIDFFLERFQNLRIQTDHPLKFLIIL